MKYQKHKLVAMGADPNKTEHEIMQSLKYYRIYDCGNIKFEYKKIDIILTKLIKTMSN